jgi:hypothetical protein
MKFAMVPTPRNAALELAPAQPRAGQGHKQAAGILLHALIA